MLLFYAGGIFSQYKAWKMAHIKAFVVAVYPRRMRGNAIRTYLRQETLTYFSDAGPF
jgi:hypothetical protein